VSQQLVPPPCTGGQVWHCESDVQLPHVPPLLLPPDELPLPPPELLPDDPLLLPENPLLEPVDPLLLLTTPELLPLLEKPLSVPPPSDESPNPG
jgi:hypothetical protein